MIFLIFLIFGTLGQWRLGARLGFLGIEAGFLDFLIGFLDFLDFLDFRDSGPVVTGGQTWISWYWK